MQRPNVTTLGLRALLGAITSSPAFAAEDNERVTAMILNLDTRGDVEARLDVQVELEALGLYLLHKYRSRRGDAEEFRDDYFAAVAMPKYREKSPVTGRAKGKDWIVHELLSDKSSGYADVRTKARHAEDLEKSVEKLLTITMQCRRTLEEKSINKRKQEEADRRTP